MPVPAQDGITSDNGTVRVDAVVYFKVIDPVRATTSSAGTALPSSSKIS
jgi:regulator of protease activity HflC (stomatin/prohibitin superfamily)